MKVVIIGAGLSGATLANALSDTCEVTVIEKGPQNHYLLPSQVGIETSLASVPTFCFGEGGTTNLWHNGLIPIDHELIDDPVLKTIIVDSSPFWDVAAKNLGYKEPVSIRKLSGHYFSKSIISKPLYYPNEITKLTLKDNVCQFYNVFDFSVEDDCVKFGGNTIKYDKLVFCSGGLSTSSLLEKHFGIKSDNSFIDHPMGFVGKIKVKKQFANEIAKVHECRTKHGSIKSALVITSENRSSAAYLRPAGSMHNSLSVNRYKSLLGASSGLSRLSKMFNIKLFHPDIISEIFNKLFKIRIFSRTYSVMLVCDQRVRSNRLTATTAALELDINEVEAFKKQLNVLYSELAPFCDSINFELDFNSSWLWSAAHHSGALPANQFIDTDLKLLGTDNVYICDASILSEHQFVNTGLTLSSIAINLAEKFKNENCDTRI